MSTFRRILFYFKVNILGIVYMLPKTYFRGILIEEAIYVNILALIIIISFRNELLAFFKIDHIL